MAVNCPCFQEVLSDALHRSGMGVDELSRRLGSRSAVQATGWLHGARLPDRRMIDALSDQLGFDRFYLSLVCWMDERPALRSDLALTMRQHGWPIPTAARRSMLHPDGFPRTMKKPFVFNAKPAHERGSASNVQLCSTAQHQEGRTMKAYNLTTWATHGLVSYEPIVAASAEEATAYAAGVLKERTRYDLDTLAKFGVHYRLGEGEIALTDLATLETEALTVIRSWSVDASPAGSVLRLLA